MDEPSKGIFPQNQATFFKFRKRVGETSTPPHSIYTPDNKNEIRRKLRPNKTHDRQNI